MAQNYQVFQSAVDNYTEKEATWESEDVLCLRHPDFILP
jgi:hypothetical protein